MTEAAMVPERPRRQRGGLVGPLAPLIGAGVVLLLNNLGVLDWGVWVVLLQLWPVLLIAVGLDLIVGRGSRLASLLIGLVALGALAAGAWYLGAAPATAAAVETVSYDVGGATRADVNLALGAGELRLAAMAEPRTA